MSVLNLAPEAIKKLMKALNKYDIDARHPETGQFYKPDDGDFPFYDPETYAQDIYNYVLEDFYTVNGYDSSMASDLLEDVLGEAENLMQEGTIDDVIESIGRGEPDGWIQQLAERHSEGFAPEGSVELDEIISTIEETAADALTYYRDNWLGYHTDELLELGVNSVDDSGAIDKIKKMYDNPPEHPPQEFWYEDEYHLDPNSSIKPGGWEDPKEYKGVLYDSYKYDMGKSHISDLLEELDGIMLSGDMDDHIASIRSGNPTDKIRSWMSSFTDYDFDVQDSMWTDNPKMDNEYAKNLEQVLTEYRDNWLGYNSDKYRPDLTESLIRSPFHEAENPGVVWKDNDWRLPGDSSQSLGVLKSDGVAPAAPQSPTGVLADPLGYPKIPLETRQQPIPGGASGRRDMQGRFRHQPPQEQAFEELLQQLGLLHQY